MDTERTERDRALSILARATGLAALGFSAVMAALLLAAAHGLLTHLKLQVNDYGTYTNFLWNSAHGRPFLCFVDQNYLRTHLSFTLLLVAPLFRVWDHPFLLMVVQWLCPLAGALIVWRVAARLKFPAPLPAVFAMLLFAYPYTQSVLTCDFHGVCLYLLLLPWLYYCLAVRRELVLLPWLLILGLREDAAFVMVPMLLYFAVKERWRAGFILAGLALAYSLLAMTWLYPQINEITLAERRFKELNAGSMAASWDVADIVRRTEALFWLLLPALPLLRRQWAPLLVFPSVALLILEASAEPRVHGLGVHYPAAVYPLLVLGIVQAWENETKAGRADGRRAVRLGAVLVALTIVAHFMAGRWPHEYRQNARRLALHPSRSGRNALWAARHIPKDGILLTDRVLAGICGNRADMLVGWHQRTNTAYRVDTVFADTSNPAGQSALLQSLSGGDFGVTYFDHRHVILQRGAAANGNAEVRLAEANRERTVDCSLAPRTHGRNAYAPGCGTARHWKGDGTATNALLCHKAAVRLAPGRYRALFRLRAEAPRRRTQGSWGLLSVSREGSEPPLATAEIDAVAGAPGEFRCQSLSFTLTEQASVEPRVRGADAPLWLDRVIFVPEDGSGGS